MVNSLTLSDQVSLHFLDKAVQVSSSSDNAPGVVLEALLGRNSRLQLFLTTRCRLAVEAPHQTQNPDISNRKNAVLTRKGQGSKIRFNAPNSRLNYGFLSYFLLFKTTAIFVYNFKKNILTIKKRKIVVTFHDGSKNTATGFALNEKWTKWFCGLCDVDAPDCQFSMVY